MVGSRGRMSQNELFLPYTINPGLAFIAPPRNGLDGVVETTFFNAKLALRPMRNLNVFASLRFEDRDNTTPQSEYLYIGGDVQSQPPPNAPTDRVRTNLPRSRRQTQLTLDADYRIAPGTAFKAGWDHDDVTRTYAEVEHAIENTLRIEFRRGGLDAWTASAGFAHLARRGAPYLYNLPFLASYTSNEFIASLVAASGCAVVLDCIRAGPLQRKFYMADRDRDRLRLFVGYAPDAALSLHARVDTNADRYPRTTYGVTDSRSVSANFEAGYAFNASTNATVFVSREHQRLRERGRQNVNPASAGNEDADWWNQMIDKTTSFGAGLRQQGLVDGKLELSVDAIAVRGRIPVSTTVGAGVSAAQNPATALPDIVARSDNVSISARYAIDRQSTLRMRVFLQRIDNADWATTQVGAATLANVIGSREIPAQTSRHGMGISWVRVFR
jgi:MtrB/PioB family decaheme-associated outer membrane protein